ncbi:N-acetyltransferase [Candidatus Pacearchaeota archaeon]|nr:N-acetyltransferase [Candidatus Pacearchaeota archaeon]
MENESKHNLKNVFIHEKAIVECSEIGDKTKIWAFAHILSGAKIGKNCNINDHTFIEGGVIIGDNVTIKCGVYLWDGVRTGNNVFIGPNVTFTNDARPRSKAYPEEFVRTYVKEGASIGANTTIICGSIIGKWALIGAGSVISKDVPDYALVYGNPAKIKGYVCECSKDLNLKDSKANCECGKIYEFKDNLVLRIK